MFKKIKTKIRHKLNQIIDTQIENYINGRPEHLARSVESVRPYLSTSQYRFRRLNKMVMDIYPELLIFDNQSIKNANSFLEKEGFKNIDLSISKNDLMFQYNLLTFEGNHGVALIEYLRDGIESFNFIEKALEDNNKNFSKVKSFLDFAAGFGKLERLLVTRIEANKIWASDIKESANKFVKNTFSVNSFNSSFDPKKLNIEKKFEIIFVGSLFSHLNEELFIEWLVALYKLIENNGILILSVHDMSLIDISDSNFVFYESSEDLVLDKAEDSIEDGEKYGTSYLTEEKFQDLLKIAKIDNNYDRYEKALWGTQDVYVLKK